MSVVIISAFAGEIPRMETRMLDAHNAVKAVNCDLGRGGLRPMKGPKLIKEISYPAKAIFKHDTDGWLSWKTPVNVIKSAVLDVDNDKPLGHLLLTGERDYPTQYLAGGCTHRLGIPRPSKAPEVSIDSEAGLATTEIYGFGVGSMAEVPAKYGTSGTEITTQEGMSVTPFASIPEDEKGEEDPTDNGVLRSTSYCYTFVQSLADGVILQESAPSPATVVLDVPKGGGVVISDFDIPEIEGLSISHIRIYRTVSGTEASDFHFVSELPVSDVINGGKYVDTAHDKDISSEILQTSIWDPIPDDAQGLIKTDNGLYACFHGNELLVSEPFIPYAFPSAYRLTVEDTIVALGHVDGTIIVLTTGRPYLAQGGVPESLQLVHLPIEQACVSASSVATLPGGVIYASPDGLMLFSSNEQTIITAQTYTRDQWRNLGPENLMGTVCDNRYIGFFSGTNKGLLFHIGRADIVQIELPDGWKIHCLYHHSEDDCIYLSAETPEGFGIWQFESGPPLPYRWRSKTFFMSVLTGMSAIRVEGEQRPGSPVVVDIFGPNEKRRRARVRLTNTKTVRIPPTRAEKLWALELTGTTAIFEARIGGNVEALEYGA